MTIFLIGPRGSGKTTVGKLLAKRLGLPFQDTDRLACERAGCSIAELVEREGWPAFRALESACLADAATGGVVATGGGAALDPENRKYMRDNGRVLYLHVPLNVLTERLERNLSAGNRPSLTGRDPVEELAAIVAEREPLYLETAHHVVDADLPLEQLVQELATMLASGG